MAQQNEPVQQHLLGLIIAAIVKESGDDGETRLRVEITSRDQDEKPWPDDAMFREDDLSSIAHAVLVAYEWLWRPLVPAQPDASSSQTINPSRMNSGRLNGRQ